MKKILFFVLIIALSQMFFSFQSRNADKINPDEMYQITLIKNGVTE